MSLKRYFPIAFAVFFAMLSSVSVYQFLRGRDGGVSQANVVSTLPIVIMKNAVGIGEKIKEHDLEIASWPEKSVPQESFRSERQLIGRTAKENIKTNVPIIESKLLPEGENFSSLIPAGMRAVTVPMRNSEALAQILERGALVDVVSLVTFPDTGITSAKVIVQEARVLAVHKSAIETNRRGEQKSDKMEVTLIVNPQEAQWIIAAINQSGVDLIVRNN